MLAYLDGQVVGWVHADRRPHLPRFDDWEIPADKAMGLIACFVVRPDMRHRGVAPQLLEAASSRLRELGCAYVDAYPVTEVQQDHPQLKPEAIDYHGSLKMYMAAGFDVIEASEHNVTHVRKRLDG